jgi:hypothetical protein
MDFRTFFFGMPVSAREEFAAKAGTSRGLLTQVAYGNKAVELGFADVIVALSDGAVELEGIELTDNAKRQRELRGAFKRRRKQPTVPQAASQQEGA